MCAYLGRFIYPLISLEGRKFWILGLLPLKREQILWGKFAFAVTGLGAAGRGGHPAERRAAAGCRPSPSRFTC